MTYYNKVSPMPSPRPAGGIISTHFHSHHSSFPIIAVAIIGILATGLLLVSYYVFVIKCCLNWHRIDILNRFSLSRRRRVDDPLAVRSQPVENRGLEESVIRSIPVFEYKKGGEKDEKVSTLLLFECVVCLNEFQEMEKLRKIPNCGHVFHIDCIDVWLQNNANCPLCRNSISPSSTMSTFPFSHDHQLLMIAPSTTPQDPILNQNHGTDNDDDYVVIEIGTQNDQMGLQMQERSIYSGELSSTISITPSPRRKISTKKGKKFSHVLSFGDECIDIRQKDEQFGVIQPIRRSFSMDSAADRQLYLAVQEIVQRQSSTPAAAEVISHLSGGGSGGRGKRSFFSFGNSRGSRNAVQPEP